VSYKGELQRRSAVGLTSLSPQWGKGGRATLDILSQLEHIYPNIALSKRVERALANKRRLGMGEGHGRSYLPYLTVRDKRFAHRYVTRILGWKTGRNHHLMGYPQRHFYAVLEWSDKVIDIREHYPLLPLQMTLAIADILGLKHPTTGKKSKDPIVLTSNFFITKMTPNGPVNEARSMLDTRRRRFIRSNAHMEIERVYWEMRNTSWRLIPYDTIPIVLAKNVLFLHDYRTLADRIFLEPTQLERVIAELTKLVTTSSNGLSNLALQCDHTFGLTEGNSLAIAYHLIANKVWQIDMNQPIEPGRKLPGLTVAPALMTSIAQGSRGLLERLAS
jgi:hypothetical protein